MLDNLKVSFTAVTASVNAVGSAVFPGNTRNRVKAHVFLCFLAAHLTWHLRKTLAELTYTDQNPPARTDPVAPAMRSVTGKRKTIRHTTTDGLPLHTYQGLLTHLATLTRNQVQYGPNGPNVPTLAQPTPAQRRAFELIGAPIPSPSTDRSGGRQNVTGQV